MSLAHPCSILFQHFQKVHVGIWYMRRARRGSHVGALEPKYVLYEYMDTLGLNPKRKSVFFKV